MYRTPKPFGKLQLHELHAREVPAVLGGCETIEVEGDLAAISLMSELPAEEIVKGEVASDEITTDEVSDLTAVSFMADEAGAADLEFRETNIPYEQTTIRLIAVEQDGKMVEFASDDLIVSEEGEFDWSAVSFPATKDLTEVVTEDVATIFDDEIRAEELPSEIPIEWTFRNTVVEDEVKAEEVVDEGTTYEPLSTLEDMPEIYQTFGGIADSGPVDDLPVCDLPVPHESVVTDEQIFQTTSFDLEVKGDSDIGEPLTTTEDLGEIAWSTGIIDDFSGDDLVPTITADEIELVSLDGVVPKEESTLGDAQVERKADKDEIKAAFASLDASTFKLLDVKKEVLKAISDLISVESFIKSDDDRK